MKISHSLNTVKKFCFPDSHKKEMEERAIERIGFGEYLAQGCTGELKRRLKNG